MTSDRKLSNVNLGKTQITPEIRVSSAAIFYEEWFGNYYQYETWVFSENKELQRSVMVIHGTSGEMMPESMIKKTQKVHQYIANNLINKFKTKQ